MQELIVMLIVAACTVYAAWVLMPSSLRRGLAQRLQHWPWPAFLGKPMRRAALAPTGCGCDAGCDAKASPPAAAKPIHFHRRPRA
ncbi:hypothetical protein [Piscinibacter sp. HJYY11]|uniref:hypothetical protein n=1 Tax=Piscinibacter sp. HJYY11 TaxID=2801333 RepID=UPI00191F10D4|nr:hypothetical protein [Piscinibacter sp. HJYY11]MBL0729274.1 hypothetical protein [Piscinibacter sp. HJYY11]